MLEEGGQVKVFEEISIRALNRIGNPARLIGVLRDLAELAHEQRIVARILDRLADAREDLGSVADQQSAKILGKNFHAVGVDQLCVRCQYMPTCEFTASMSYASEGE